MVDVLGQGSEYIGGPDLNRSDTTPQRRPGTIYSMQDYFGLRKFVYVRNQHGAAVTAGQWLGKVAIPSSVTATSGSTTSVTKSSASFTVDTYKGYAIYCMDDAGAAGAAPEGECSIVESNSATVIYLNSGRAFTAAAAANDVFGLFPLGHARLADSDNSVVAFDTYGVVMCDSLADGDYGWCQYDGFHPAVKCVVTAQTQSALTNLIVSSTAGACGVGSTSTAIELTVGYAMPGAISAGGDLVGLKMPAYIRCFIAATTYAGTTP